MIRMNELLAKKLDRKQSAGFTLLELMIAISIFSLLMIYIAQLMKQEIRSYDQILRQYEIEQKARVATMQVLDEIRLHNYTYYSFGGGTNPGPTVTDDSGVYYYDPDNNGEITCLIDVNPSNPEILPDGTVIYYDSTQRELWYKDKQTGAKYLIADEIDSFSLWAPDQTDVHFVGIDIVTRDSSSGVSYELLTWVRLY